jgi:hypothetical protein
MKPVHASMQMRPCLSSASRRKSMGAKSEKRRGSNPTSPTYPSRFSGYGRKGRASDFFAAREVAERAVGEEVERDV